PRATAHARSPRLQGRAGGPRAGPGAGMRPRPPGRARGSRRSPSSLLGQRHIDETAYASRLECKFHLAIEVMAEAALHQPSAETTARRRDHAGAAAFPPFQAQATLAGAPADRDLPF